MAFQAQSEALVSVFGAHVAINDCFIKDTTINLMTSVFVLTGTGDSSVSIGFI